MKHLLTLTLSAAIGLGSLMTAHADAPTTGNPHELAQRFAGGKLSNMLFSTKIQHHMYKKNKKNRYKKPEQNPSTKSQNPKSTKQTNNTK